MGKKNKKRPNWQQQGFRSYTEYKQHTETTSIANTAKTAIADMFQECLQEAINSHIVKERQHQEAADRLKYHNLRLQGL